MTSAPCPGGVGAKVDPPTVSVPNTVQAPPQFQQRVLTGTSTSTAQGSDSVLHPLLSSGVGLHHTQPSGGCPANPRVYPFASSTYPFRAPYLHPNTNTHSHIPPISLKVPSSAFFAPDSNGHQDPLNKGTNDIFVSVRDRKVRISDRSSIYGLCRSWLRNGYPEESQVQYGDFIKPLPKPSPTSISESSLTERKESDDEIEIEEDEKSIENLSAKQLLERHIKRAKRVRARLREERLQRIARYKNRLSLLLPTVMEHCGNDTTTRT